MPKYHNDIQQNTEEWHAERLRRFTASPAPQLLSGKDTKGYADLINKIAEERFTGEPCQSQKFTGNKATDRGHEFEPIAIKDYEKTHFETVKTVGFVSIDDKVGCSPDGLIGDNGLLQIKCPYFSTQDKYLKLLEKHKKLTDNERLVKIDNGYYKQMQFELYVTGREYNIFYSYHPKLKEVELEIERDESILSTIKQRLKEANSEVDEIIKGYKGR